MRLVCWPPKGTHTRRPLVAYWGLLCGCFCKRPSSPSRDSCATATMRLVCWPPKDARTGRPQVPPTHTRITTHTQGWLSVRVFTRPNTISGRLCNRHNEAGVLATQRHSHGTPPCATHAHTHHNHNAQHTTHNTQHTRTRHTPHTTHHTPHSTHHTTTHTTQHTTHNTHNTLYSHQLAKPGILG